MGCPKNFILATSIFLNCNALSEISTREMRNEFKLVLEHVFIYNCKTVRTAAAGAGTTSSVLESQFIMAKT